MPVHFQLGTLKKGGSISEFFQKFKTLTDTLTTAGQPLNDFELVSFLLAGLGSKFDPFVTYVTTYLDPMLIEELYAHLLTHEMCMKHTSTAIDSVFRYANIAAPRPPFQKNKGTYHGPPKSNGPNSSKRSDGNCGRGCGKGSTTFIQW